MGTGVFFLGRGPPLERSGSQRPYSEARTNHNLLQVCQRSRTAGPYLLTSSAALPTSIQGRRLGGKKAAQQDTYVLHDIPPRPRKPMANTMQTLPRFLLPRLSWTAPVGQPFAKASVIAAAAATQVGGSNSNSSSRRQQRPWPSTIRTQSNHMSTATSTTTRLPKSVLQQPGLRRAFHASAPRRRDHHFDTLKFVQRLQSEGFTEEQSVAMMKVLNDVIQER